jgi:hypothetical protein
VLKKLWFCSWKKSIVHWFKHHIASFWFSGIKMTSLIHISILFYIYSILRYQNSTFLIPIVTQFSQFNVISSWRSRPCSSMGKVSDSRSQEVWMVRRSHEIWGFS